MPSCLTCLPRRRPLLVPARYQPKRDHHGVSPKVKIILHGHTQPYLPTYAAASPSPSRPPLPPPPRPVSHHPVSIPDTPRVSAQSRLFPPSPLSSHRNWQSSPVPSWAVRQSPSPHGPSLPVTCRQHGQAEQGTESFRRYHPPAPCGDPKWVNHTRKG